MRRTGAGLAFGAGMMMAAACTLLDTSGLSGGADASDAGDAGDAGDDAAVDGVAAGDAASRTGFCGTRSPTPVFCADFDEDPAVDKGWSQSFPGKALELDHDLPPPSPPASLQVRTASFAPENGKYAASWLQQRIHLATVPKRIHFELSVYPGVLGPEPTAPGTPTAFTDARIFTLQTSTGGQTYELLFSARTSTTAITEHAVPPDQYTEHAFTTGGLVAFSWRHITLDLDYETRRVHVTADGAGVLADETMVAEGVATTDITLNVGLPNCYDAEGCAVQIDNVLLSVE